MVLMAALAYFAVAFAAGFALGVVRELLLVPRIGALAAVAIELPIMLAVSWIAARWVVDRWPVRSTAGLVAVGGLAFLLLQAAEFALGTAMGRSPADYTRDLQSTRGQIGLAAQVAFAAFPLLVGRRR